MNHKKVNVLLLSITLVLGMSINTFAIDNQSINSPPSIIEIEVNGRVISVVESNNKNFDFLMEIALEDIKGVTHEGYTRNNDSLLGEISPAAIFCCDPNYRLRTWTTTHHDWKHTGPGNNCTVTIYEIVLCERCGSIWSKKIIRSYRHHHS